MAGGNQSSPDCFFIDALDVKGGADFVKRNSNEMNAKSTDDPAYSVTLNAFFSHWTYEYTPALPGAGGCAGHCARQGQARADRPSHPLYCSDASRFGGTNFAEDGIYQFLGAHTCKLAVQDARAGPRQRGQHELPGRDPAGVTGLLPLFSLSPSSHKCSVKVTQLSCSTLPLQSCVLL